MIYAGKPRRADLRPRRSPWARSCAARSRRFARAGDRRLGARRSGKGSPGRRRLPVRDGRHHAEELGNRGDPDLAALLAECFAGAGDSPKAVTRRAAGDAVCVRHARPCAGHPRLQIQMQERKTWAAGTARPDAQVNSSAFWFCDTPVALALGPLQQVLLLALGALLARLGAGTRRGPWRASRRQSVPRASRCAAASPPPWRCAGR